MAGSSILPSGPPSQLYASPAGMRRSNSTSSRWPASGWNGWVTTTNSEPAFCWTDLALCALRCDAERPRPPVRLRDVRPPRRPCPVTPCVHPVVQVGEVGLQLLPPGRPRHPVHPRRGLRADRPVRRPETIDVDVVQQRGKPRVLVPPCHFTHTVQRTWRAWSGAGSGARFAGRVPLGWAPFLHRLRRRTRGLVRRLRRYYAPI